MANSNFIVKNGLTVGNISIDAASGNITGLSNMTFGSGANIYGDFSNATISSRTALVTTATNSNTGVYAFPAGTATAASFQAANSSGTNASKILIVANGTTDNQLVSGINGAGTYLPLTIWNSGAEKVRVDTNGNVGIANNSPAHTLSVTGTANISGNANIGNIGTATAIITTANVTTINSGLLQNGTSNVTVNSSGNVNISVGGNVLTVTSTGANISGTLNTGTGNANVGNLGTATAIITTGNITTINSGLMQNGNSNVTITANSNVTIAVTAANSYTFATGSFAPSANATVQLGLTGARWSNIWGLASSAQYADLAEYYLGDIKYEPGTVIDFGGNNEVTICDTVMSTKIAGVVSTQPGFIMNDADLTETSIPVALTGRVPTKVVGPISKGDMMVSAGNGHAMACSNPVIGSVIGKALEDLSAGEGVIEVVVGRL